MNELDKSVFTLLSSPPIDISEEQEDTFTISASDRWVLAKERADGSVRIGLFNVWSALKVIADATNEDWLEPKIVDTLVEICDNLVNENLLKNSPSFNRQLWKVITNEETNAERKERGPYYRPSDD